MASKATYASANPFSILSNKKARDKVERTAKKREEKTLAKEAAPKKEERKQEEKKVAKEAKVEAKKADAGPKKESKVLSLKAPSAEEAAAAAAKDAAKKDALEAKAAKAKNDKQDKSGKADRVRKDGKGTGGWEDNKPAAEGAAAAEGDVAAEADAVKEEKKEDSKPVWTETEDEKATREEEIRQREIEAKQITFSEYQIQQAAEAKHTFNIRTVDNSAFKNMKKNVKEVPVDDFLSLRKDKKATAGKSGEKKDKVQIDVSFRMEKPETVRGQKGEGKGGKGGGKGKGEGRKGGGGKGATGGKGAAPATETAAPAVTDHCAFPELGATSAPAPVAAEVAAPVAEVEAEVEVAAE